MLLALSRDLKRRPCHLGAVVYIEQHPGFGDDPEVLLLALLPLQHLLLFSEPLLLYFSLSRFLYFEVVPVLDRNQLGDVYFLEVPQLLKGLFLFLEEGIFLLLVKFKLSSQIQRQRSPSLFHVKVVLVREGERLGTDRRPFVEDR